MEDLDTRKTLEGSPGTGGSGGGPNKDIFPKPEPLATLGLNANVVYGTNVQVACPLNFQLALGGNLQVCISPNAGYIYDENPLIGTGDPMSATLPSAVTNFLGSGLGGNMQFTMGTSANFVVGQSFDINLGPRRIALDVHKVTGIQTCMGTTGKLVIALTWVFVLAYAIPNDDFRSILTMAYQLTMQIMMGLLMDVQGIYKQMEKRYQDVIDQTFSAGPKDEDLKEDAFRQSFTSENTISGHSKINALVMVVIIPIVLEIIGEIRLDVSHDPPEDVVDSANHKIGTVKDDD